VTAFEAAKELKLSLVVVGSHPYLLSPRLAIFRIPKISMAECLPSNLYLLSIAFVSEPFV
jgi:hypothetical protein